MKTTTKKKIFATLLTLAMVLAIAPTPVRAASEPYAAIIVQGNEGNLYYYEQSGGSFVVSFSRCLWWSHDSNELRFSSSNELLTSNLLTNSEPAYAESGKYLVWQEPNNVLKVKLFGSKNAATTVENVSFFNRDEENFVSKVFMADGTEKSVAALAAPAPTAAPTATPAATVAPTATPVATATPTATPVPTATPTAAPTATPTAAPTATPAATVAPTATPVTTAEPTATPTATPVPTATPTAAPTATPATTVAPTATAAPTATPVATATPTVTAAPTTTPAISVKNSANLRKSTLFINGDTRVLKISKNSKKVTLDGMVVKSLSKHQYKKKKIRFYHVGFTVDKEVIIIDNQHNIYRANLYKPTVFEKVRIQYSWSSDGFFNYHF